MIGGLGSDWVRRKAGALPGAVAALAVMGVACLVLGGTRVPYVAAVAFGAVGCGIAIWQTLITAFRQTTIPQDILGRVNGVFRLLSVCVSPFGAITAGVVAKYTEVNVPILVSGVRILALTAISTGPLLRLGAAQPAHGRLAAPACCPARRETGARRSGGQGLAEGEPERAEGGSQGRADRARASTSVRPSGLRMPVVPACAHAVMSPRRVPVSGKGHSSSSRVVTSSARSSSRLLQYR